MALNSIGSILATASDQGTIISLIDTK